jgi:hypothetical protein
LVIDPEANEMSAWRLDADGDYQAVAARDNLVIDICESCRLPLDVTRMLR